MSEKRDKIILQSASTIHGPIEMRVKQNEVTDYEAEATRLYNFLVANLPNATWSAFQHLVRRVE